MNRTVMIAGGVLAGFYLAVVPLAVVFYAALSGGTSTGCAGPGGPGGGDQQLGGRDRSAEQMNIAQTIVQVVAQRRLPRRAAEIAIATGLVESNLENVSYGDRDSLGVFQQRPSTGWGSPEQVTNPAYATGSFLDRLVQIPGWHDPRQVSLGQAAQTVQQSAFPERYQPREAEARMLVDRFWHGPDNPPPATAATQRPAQQATRISTGCPDQGGSNVPLDPKKLPPGFQLPADPRQRAAVEFALAQIGKPYVYGAKGPDAFDCSGLMQAAWAHAAVPIPAGTTDQRNVGEPVASLAAVQPGDLLLIPGSLGTPSNPRHIGMYVGNGLLVNAYDEQHGIQLEDVHRWRDIVTIRRPAQPTIPAPPLPIGEARP